MKKLLIYGAGAIGRGYVPWVFPPDQYELTYVESNPTLRDQLNTQKYFTTYCTKNDQYHTLKVPIAKCFSPGEELPSLSTYDGIITAVGPRHVQALAPNLAKATCPIVLFENDETLTEILQKLSKNPHIYFGIPDVITSNTAPQKLLDKDPLSIVTENGTCFIDDRAKSLGGNNHYVDKKELTKQWLAKLYIHNTPHCIAAYCGSLCHKTYLHEGMQIPQVYDIVKKAMLEMSQMLKIRYHIDTDFIDWYSEKELSRFANVLLYDPISRVAREPFRKLEPDNRLIGAAQLALASGVIPHNIMKGIFAAFLYNKTNDPDFNITYLVNALTPENFLKLIIKLNPHEALFKLLVEAWGPDMTELKRMQIK